MLEEENHIFITPIYNLEITKDLNYEIKIGRVTFIDKTKLFKNSKKYFKKGLINENFLGLKKEFFDDSKATTFAFLINKGHSIENENELKQNIQDALDILAFSIFPYHSDSDNFNLSTIEHKAHSKYFTVNQDVGDISSHLKIETGVKKLNLNSEWESFNKQFVIFELIKIFNSFPQPKYFNKKWANNLIQVVKMIGKANQNSDFKNAFLTNMIALEMLLTTKNDNYSKSLPERVEAFIGWTLNWQRDNLYQKVIELYKKRCEIVHEGNFNNVLIDDYLLIRELNFNIIWNIVKHPKDFCSKENVIEFSEKLKAEKLLGLKNKVKPKSLRFMTQTTEILPTESIKFSNHLIK